MTDTPKTVFVTKYALTSGIKEARVTSDRGNGYLFVESHPHSSFGPSEYALTREAAVSRANQMRDTKLASLTREAERVRWDDRGSR